MKIQLKNQISRQLMTVTSETTVARAYHIMTNEWIRHLPVVSPDGETVLGLVSDRDLLGAENKEWPVKQVMSSHVLSYEITTPVKTIVHSMIEDKISSFLVTQNGGVVGIVTTEDMLILLSQLLVKEEENDLILQKWIANPVTQNAIHMLSQAGI